ncbi:DUF4159 domain-containing protein [Candidatus Chlorohelix sp.]|uniref:DUF4159 domain-containing protein n=1 Tax=Candidatus Chlorohelix sp. TaxID=3139201 RepID=UPI003054ECA2
MTFRPQTTTKFRFLRVNPFRGLLIDENTWADAHDYHRNMMRFHLLSMHGVGIVQGLEVVAMQPADNRLTVKQGVAIDSEGRLLYLSEPQIITMPPADAVATAFVVLEYQEKQAQMQAVTDGGKAQPTRVLESCQVRASLEPVPGSIEIARISYNPATKQVRNPTVVMQPGPNEIDMTARVMAAGTGASANPVRQNRISLTVGIVRYGPPASSEWKRHSDGVRRLLRDVGANTILDANLLDGVSPMDEAAIRSCRVLYMTGRVGFGFSPEEEQSLRRFLDRGGILWCEPCRNGLPSGTPDDFSRSSIELAQRLNRQLIQPRFGHPLLNSRYLFASSPPALDPAGVVVEANRLIITGGDYGCLWEGRGQERAEPPSREILRSAGEFGANALFMAVEQG